MPKGVKKLKNSSSRKTINEHREKITILPNNKFNQHVGVICKNFGGKRYDVEIESDTGHKGKKTNAKAHFGKKNVNMLIGDYVLLEYSDLNSGSFYIIHKYQPNDVSALLDKNIILPKKNTDGNDEELIFTENHEDEIINFDSI